MFSFLFQFLSRRSHRRYLLTGEGLKSLCYEMRIVRNHLLPAGGLHHVCHMTCIDELDRLELCRESVIKQTEVTITWALSCSAEWRSARMRTSQTFSTVRPLHRASSHITCKYESLKHYGLIENQVVFLALTWAKAMQWTYMCVSSSVRSKVC